MSVIVTSQNNSDVKQAALDVYNPSLPQDIKENVITNNMNLISTRLNSMGVNLLASLQKTDKQTVTSASYVPVTNLAQAVDCSGGLVFIFGNLNYRFGSAQSLALGVFIDGTLQSNSGGSANGAASIVCVIKLTKGSHNIELRAKVDGGTATLNNNLAGDVSSFFVAEVLI